MRGIFAQRIGARGGSQAADDLLRRTLRMAEPEAPIPLLRARQKNGKPFLPDYLLVSIHWALIWNSCASCAAALPSAGFQQVNVRCFVRCLRRPFLNFGR